MKALIKNLLFDREIVNAIKASKTNEELLYAQLYAGRITLKEYVAAIENTRQ